MIKPPVALLTYLAPFQTYFEMDGVSEICINRAEELWVEQHGRFQRYDAPILTYDYLWQLARLTAEYNERAISAETPTLSSTLPNGYRVQFVVPPACEKGTFVCSIRRPSVARVSLEQYFKHTPMTSHNQDQDKLLAAYFARDYASFLSLAILQRKNIIISGGTSTGKTTFLNSLLDYVPKHERLITIETDREVKSYHPNAVHLLAAEEGKSVAKITMLGLLKASLRLRPDRILVSELRAEEAFPYLRAINSGHPGSMTTLHADTPEGCFNQLAFMVIQSGSHLSRQELVDYAKSIVHIVVQIKRDDAGERYVSEVYFSEAVKRPTAINQRNQPKGNQPWRISTQ